MKEHLQEGKPRTWDFSTLHATENQPRRGLVLSGGAALGAYQAGALKVLKESQIKFEVISATSIGTLHALAWNMDETLMTIDEHWVQNVAGSPPFDPLRVFKGENPFQYRSSIDNVFDKYRNRYPQGQDNVEILVTVTEHEHCRPTVFSMRDPTLQPEEREAILKASTVIPHLGISPVALRGKHYYDGGYTDNLPISALEKWDLDEIWVIPLMPVLKKKRLFHRAQNLCKRFAYRLPGSRLRPLLTLSTQILQSVEQTFSGAKIILVSPESLREAFQLFQLMHALTFTQKNIKRLQIRGRTDATSVARSYWDQMNAYEQPLEQPGKKVFTA